MELSIIIVNWNSAEYLRTCLRSVYQHTPGVEFEVVVLDSGSFDGCAGMLATEFPLVRFIQSEKNLGFARGNNLAASRAKGRMLLFLNPDTELRSAGFNELLRAARRLPDAGALGARLLNSDGTLQTSCIQSFPTIANQVLDADVLRQLFPRARLWGTAPLYAGSFDPLLVEGISGACLMTPRCVFEGVGGFSEDYFMYFEDMDYCMKAQKAGWKNYYIPRAEVVHHGGKSDASANRKFSSVMAAESAWRFFRKAHGRSSAGLFRLCLAAKAASRSCLLAVACSLARSGERRQRFKGALLKWISVARWAAGAESWVAKF